MPLDKKATPPEVSEIFAPKFHSAELVFAFLMLGLALFLAGQYDAQTRILEGQGLISQPGFWSWLSVAGMLVFCLPYSFFVIKKYCLLKSPEPVSAELVYWLFSIEFAIWFLVYVLLVPKAGYLPATVVFTLTLTYRAGYRDARYFIFSIIFSIISVLIFKTFLGVSIPGGALYEIFPPLIRNFLIVNF